MFAQDKDKPEKPSDTESVHSTQDRMSKLIALGPGVHSVIKDKNGQIVSCVVVGQSRISTVLGKAKGLEVARDKATLACSAEFVKWLTEEVNIFQSAEDETIILLTGGEGAVDDSIQESGKSIEKTTKKIESVSKGLIRGMQLLHKEVDSDGKTYSIVKGWKAETAEATKVVNENLNARSSNPMAGKTGKSMVDEKDKELKDETATSENADEFFREAN